MVTEPLNGELVGPGEGPRAELSPEATPALHVRLAGEWLLSFDSVHTREAYRRDAGAFFTWCAEFGIDPLAAAPLHADGFRQYTAGALGKKASRARRLAAVSSFYRFVRRRHPELRLDNPFDGVARPRTSRTSSTVGLSMEQTVTLFEHAEQAGPRADVIVQVLLATGTTTVTAAGSGAATGAGRAVSEGVSKQRNPR